MEAEVKRKKRKRVEDGTEEEKGGGQDAGERSEVSNGCEYIAVINFAKSRRREEERKEDTVKVSLACLVHSWLRSLFLAKREGGRREKPKESPHLTISGHHVSGTCLGGHLFLSRPIGNCRAMVGQKLPLGRSGSTPSSSFRTDQYRSHSLTTATYTLPRSREKLEITMLRKQS